jgi:phage shock protein PspC (stress-responsive transcriptional regulator)
MTSQGTDHTGAPPRLLRRRVNDRVLGGVAGGLGDYFNIDPLLIRIGFVGLMIFGGAGLVLYVVAWLLLPAEGHDASAVEAFFRHLGLTPGRLGWLAVALVAFILLVNSWNTGMGFSIREGPLGIPGVLWALAIVVTGVMLVRRREVVAAPSMAPAASTAAVLVAPAVKGPHRPRSPLAWYACGAVLLSIGLLALVSEISDIPVAPGQFFGAALAILGISLVVGAWWGRARILILLALLLMPLGVAASFITTPLEGGIGDLRLTPANAAELRDEYRMMGGTLILDLTDLSIGRGPVRIAASVAVGQLVVILPPDASVELRARMGAGQVTIFDAYGAGTILGDAGTSLDERYVRHQSNGPTYVLDLEGGIGDVFVTNSRINW